MGAKNSSSTEIENHDLQDLGHHCVMSFDVLLLFYDLVHNLSLPCEVLQRIFEFSACDLITISFTYSIEHHGDNFEDYVYFSKNITPIRWFQPYEVHVIVQSKDQGWSSYPADHNSYRDTWTWNELCILQNDYLYRLEINRNLHAGRQYIEYDKSIQFPIPNISCNEDMQLQIRSRSLYPGWSNNILCASIEMTWKLKCNIETIEELHRYKIKREF